MDTGGRDTWGTETAGDRPRQKQTDRRGVSKDLERERDRHLDRGTQRSGWASREIHSAFVPAPPSLVAQTCTPHVAGPSARIYEVQVSVGICGLLCSVFVTAPLRNYSCPKGVLHSHRWVGIPRSPTLAQGPSGGMRVEHEPWVSH